MRKLEVVEQHHQFFLDFGFSYDPAISLYSKDFPHGKQAIFVHYTDSTHGNQLEYSLGIRINLVEETIHKFLPSLSGFSDRSLTLTQPPNKINKELPKVFFIANNWELAQIFMKSEKFFVQDGFHWLDQMVDPVFLERSFFNKSGFSFKTQNFIYNAFRATALAKFYNPEDYPVVRKAFLVRVEQQQQMTPFTLASYLQFLNYLDHLS